ncbi:NADP transhydrogenase subunit alpha [Sphingobium indicum]|uniref:NADP transhydrogenase subunit alpha n=1 Tax=Sphingobium indicum TaxID=332055 RepID=A0A4Q4JAP4_9SPHN|nr:proton-translocating transhydrogenase family protein [Sphingobium indicum]NYI21989.1 NAD(P) transhydrogenase subunit alpha [Sphingobium indicum]RYM03258.1 NADP transhydrogenase subunit alpha [Sphingobium indicum]
MMAFLLPFFLAACIVGALVAWRTRPDEGWALVSVLQMLSSAILLGALIVSAEAGSSLARIFGLLAIVVGSAGLCGGFVAARRIDMPPRP